MDYILYALKLVGIIGAMTLIIPIMVAGGAGSWKAGFKAWVSYLKVMGGLVVLGCGTGLLMILGDLLNH